MKNTNISVLRLSHRKERDKRITTHVFLVARTFGASSCFYTGDKDTKIEENIKEVTEKWGSSFRVQHVTNYRRIITEHEGISVHLTMYGHSHLKAVPIIKKILSDQPEKNNSLLVIVGGKKVPADVYKLVDFNVAISFQPHSEVAAVAIFLYDFLGHDFIYRPRTNAQVQLTGGEKAKGKMDGMINSSSQEKTFLN